MWQNWLCMGIILIMCLFGYIFIKMRTAINNWRFAIGFSDFVDTLENRYFKYFILLIMAVAVIIRLWKFGLIPAGFNQDGAMAAVEAYALARQGGADRVGVRFPVALEAWGWSPMYVLLSYLSVPFVAIFGLNRFSARMAIVIVSILALWVLYSLCKLIFGRRIAAVVLAFAAINPWQIMQSRWSLEANMFPHFFLFSTYFLYLGLLKNKKYLYLSMLLFGITMYSYGIAFYIVPLFLLLVGIYLLLKKKISLKETFLAMAPYLFTAWPIYLLMIVNYFKLPTIITPFCTIPYFPESSRMSDLLFFRPDFWKELTINFFTTVNVVILQMPDAPFNSIPEYGTIYLFSIPFAAIGLIGLTAKSINNQKYTGQSLSQESPGNNNTHLYVPLLIWLLVAFISGLITNVNINRINIIWYPIIILSGLGISFIIRKIKLFSVVISIIFLTAFAGFTASYFGEHARVLGQEFCEGFGEAMTYVEDLDWDRIYVTNWSYNKGNQFISDIFTLFFHHVRPSYYQDKEKAYSKTGRELLPYHERYQFVNFEDFTFNPEEKAVYIVNNNDVLNYDPERFQITRFVYYSAIIPKQLINANRL